MVKKKKNIHRSENAIIFYYTLVLIRVIKYYLSNIAYIFDCVSSVISIYFFQRKRLKNKIITS
jgi:hypothetical protein